MLFDHQSSIRIVLVQVIAFFFFGYFKVTSQCRLRKESVRTIEERNSLCPGLGLVAVENRPESRSKVQSQKEVSRNCLCREVLNYISEKTLNSTYKRMRFNNQPKNNFERAL